MVGFFSTVRRTLTNLVAILGCHRGMVIMAMVSSKVFLDSSEGITCKFPKSLSWYQNFLFRVLKFYENLFSWQQGKYKILLCFTA